MSLSKETVRKIVRIISADRESCDRISSWISSGLAARMGYGGLVRNLVMGTVGLSPGDQSSTGYRLSCDGIADATAAAISNVIKKSSGSDPRWCNVVKEPLREVLEAKSKARSIDHGFSHTGTAIYMKDGTQYVLDWWMSLNVEDPHIFRYDDFIYNRGNSVRFSDFNGWSG